MSIGAGAALVAGVLTLSPGAAARADTPSAASTSTPAHTVSHTDLSALAINACAAAGDFIDIAGQGPLCQADQSFVLRLRTGTRVTVAPPDMASVLASGSKSVPHSSAPLISQQCVSSGTPRVELVYAHFSDQPDNFSSHSADVQQIFRDVDADYINYDALHWFGQDMHLNVECDGSGNPVVHDVGLSTPLGGSDFSTITSDMQSQGYDQSDTHYWIWTDGNPVAAYGYAGQSTVQEDDSAGAGNSINTAYEYSVDYGYPDGNYGPQVFAHENGHAMGAVQLSAPDSTGAFHCTDGQDVMCYDDGGPRGADYTSSDCGAAPNGTEVFDCSHNDYFNAAPAAGSYLATHWDLASPNNHWLYIGPVATSTAVGYSASSGVYSQPLTVEAAVSAGAPAAPPSSGTVTFYDNGSSVGSASVNGAGQAFLTLTTLGVGSHSITASFAGTTLAEPSSSSGITYTVNQASTSTGLASSANPAGNGVPFTLSATVRPLAPATAAPSGSVTFHAG
ncbi:MAG: Ig-like domain repeat protein, partial [Candidatus Dormibacteraeota bacterium]|nr:Ig-like domain repeat protein [Candidatus Dormibacteraeota bacterium]